MVVYHHRRLELKDDGERASEWSHDKTETLQKLYKSHRDVNIIDGTFILKVMRECIGVKCEETGKIKANE